MVKCMHTQILTLLNSTLVKFYSIYYRYMHYFQYNINLARHMQLLIGQQKQHLFSATNKILD